MQRRGELPLQNFIEGSHSSILLHAFNLGSQRVQLGTCIVEEKVQRARLWAGAAEENVQGTQPAASTVEEKMSGAGS